MASHNTSFAIAFNFAHAILNLSQSYCGSVTLAHLTKAWVTQPFETPVSEHNLTISSPLYLEKFFRIKFVSGA